jgi:hypothetical protein
VVSPFAYSDSTISSTSVSRRCRFFTICGSNVPSRSRGTSMSTSPAASEITVFDRDPLRMFVDSRPGSAWCFGCPRCSVSSSLSAVSSTLLVNSFNSPFGPVSSSPRPLASATIAAAAACSGDSCRLDSLSRLRGLTGSDVITHSAHPAGPQPGVSGRKHRLIHSPGSQGAGQVAGGLQGVGVVSAEYGAAVVEDLLLQFQRLLQLPRAPGD